VPDATRTGTTAAGNLNRTNAGDAYVTAYSASRTIKAGDYFLAGVWVRPSTTAGVSAQTLSSTGATTQTGSAIAGRTVFGRFHGMSRHGRR